MSNTQQELEELSLPARPRLAENPDKVSSHRPDTYSEPRCGRRYAFQGYDLQRDLGLRSRQPELSLQLLRARQSQHFGIGNPDHNWRLC